MSHLSPPVLFFFLGMFAALVRSNLRVPEAVTKVLSLYLLWAIGFKGGVELRASGLTPEALRGLGAALALASAVPVYTFYLLRRRLALADAAALAAAYGSISAVTFMAATQWLDTAGVAYGGHMVAAMVLMESPAIVVAVILMRRSGGGGASGWSTLLHEAFLNGPVLLLLGSLAVGLLTGERGYAAFKPLCTDLFSGVLVFFLLDLGILAAERLKDLRERGAFLVSFAVAVPLLNAAVALVLSRVLGLEEGNAILLVTLAASASYIAVPAAARLVLPEANPSLYLPMVLALTFPFNIGIGIPLYAWAVGALRSWTG
ncbi:MAG TPA: sodium-dependent bicarbonate transport family permease [Candidatus Polarisedimenticolaceae bacterium]